MQHRNRWYLGVALALAAVGFALPTTVTPDAPSAGVSEPSATPADPAMAPAVVAAAPVAVEPAVVEPAVVEPAVAAPALEVVEGSASYYADMFEGRTTASGRPFRQAEPVAAHRTYPFGTRLRVTNLANARQVEVEVVDRGPFAHGRVLDLSKAMARQLDFIRQGHTRVRIEVLEWGGR